MKRLLFTLSSLVLVNTGHADLEVPKKVLPASKLAEASAKAKAENKGVAIVYTHVKTN